MADTWLIKIKKWGEFQHYKKRTPPWIKLHRSILDNREWAACSGDACKLLAECWLTASQGETSGQIDGTLSDLAWQLRRPPEVVSALLEELAAHGFLTINPEHASTALATRKQSARQGEAETETEDRGRDRGSVAIATGADAPPNGPTTATAEPLPIDRIDDREQRRSAYLQTFMPVLREVGLHDDGTNGSIIKALADKRAPPTGMEEAIRGLPLVMPAEMPGGELKLLYATKRDDIAEPMWNRAKRAYFDSTKGEVSSLVREMTG